MNLFKLLDERAGNPVFNDNMHAANTKVGGGNRDLNININ
jgi:hypothetical protein